MNVMNLPHSANSMDDVYFLGDNIPVEVTKILPLLPHISIKSFKKLIQLVSKYLTINSRIQGNEASDGSTSSSQLKLLSFVERTKELEVQLNKQIEEEVIHSLDEHFKAMNSSSSRNILKLKQSKYELDQIQNIQQTVGVFPVLFTAFFIILQQAIRQKLKSDELADQLLKLTFSQDLIKLLVQYYDTKQEELQQHAIKEEVNTWYNKLDKFRWRVDITISTSSMTRVLKPNLLFQFVLANGQMKTFEVSLEKFHELRLQVASVLNDMNIISNHPIMQIK